jgi:hypothetical protein
MTKSSARFFQARVVVNDLGILQFLIHDDVWRSAEEISRLVLRASFLSLALDSHLCESSESAQVQEIDEETFRRICGQRIPSEEISGIEFWWMK